MELSTIQSDESITISFAGELNIYAMGSLNDSLSDWLLTPKALVIDMQQLLSLDGSGLQLLLFIKHARAQSNQQTIFENLNEQVHLLLTKVGLENIFAANENLGLNQASMPTAGGVKDA